MKKNGYIAFTSILIISVVALSVAMSITILGINEAKSSLTYKKGQETLKIAESCLEEALIKIRNNQEYSGETLNILNGSCTINIETISDTKTLSIGATLSGNPDYRRNITVEVIRVANDVIVTGWQENP